MRSGICRENYVHSSFNINDPPTERRDYAQGMRDYLPLPWALDQCQKTLAWRLIRMHFCFRSNLARNLKNRVSMPNAFPLLTYSLWSLHFRKRAARAGSESHLTSILALGEESPYSILVFIVKDLLVDGVSCTPALFEFSTFWNPDITLPF